MTFVAQIKADGSQFQTTVDTLATKLTVLETKAKETGDTTTTAFDKAGGATEEFTEKVSGSTSAHDKLIAALDRERDMLAAINGPAKQYAQNLETLDSLLTKDMISTEQYAEQVRQLNAQLERQQTIRETATEAPAASGGGFNMNGMVGAMAGAGVFGAALLGLGHTIESVIEDFRRLDDEATNLRNNQLRFTDAAHGTTAVMAQQDQIATALHTTMKDTSNVYYGVRNALIDYGMSAEQVARVTQTVGEAAMMAGKPLESAGEVVNRMIVAMNSGADSARSLRMIMVEYPELARVWEEAFHTSTAGLMQMVKQGKVGAQDLAMAWSSATNTIDADYQKRGVTYQQEIDRQQELVAVYTQYGISLSKAYALASNGIPIEENLINYLRSRGRVQEALNIQMQQGVAYAKDLYDQFENLAHAKEKLAEKKVDDDLGSALYRAMQANQVLDAIPYQNMSAKLQQLHEQQQQQKDDLDALKAMRENGAIGLKDYDAMVQMLGGHQHKLTAYEQEEKRILDDINGARDRFNLGMEAAFSLYANGTISLKQYRQELEKLQADYNRAQPKPDSVVQSLGFHVAAPPAGPTSVPYETATGFAFPAEQDPAKLTEQWKKELASYTAEVKKTEAAIKTIFDPLVKGINQFFQTGQFNVKQFGASILDTIEQIIMKELEMKAIAALAGALTPGIPNVFSSGGPMSGSVFGALLGGVPGFASGGDGVVGGSGGTDSQIFIARATPGEHYSFRTPHQMAQQESGGKPTQVTVIDGRDPRAITSAWAQSSEFERHVIRIARKHGFGRN